MDADGNVLAEPQFDYFDSYHAEHRLLTVGDHEDALGVYSLDRQEWIIPVEYDYVSYGEHMISCEIAYTCKDRYFDYSGKELDFSEYESVHEEENGLLWAKKNEKIGYIKTDGTEVVPFILQSSFGADIELYKKGYLITGERKKKGFATVGGREILPEKYSEINVYKDFLIASERNDCNWCIRDTLFDYEGRQLLPGPYRNICFDKDTGEMSARTPFGRECFELA